MKALNSQPSDGPVKTFSEKSKSVSKKFRLKGQGEPFKVHTVMHSSRHHHISFQFQFDSNIFYDSLWKVQHFLCYQ